MPITPLSLTARTLYAELREMALAVGATQNIGELPGTIVTKTIRERTYVYHQYRDLAGATRQTYLGPDNAATRALTERLAADRSVREADLERLVELRSAFLAAGGTATASGPFRVIQAFANAGMLHPATGAAVLVGTHGFVALGNHLGFRWSGQLTTQDIDLAAARDIDVAVAEPAAAVPDVLERLGLGFIPVPTLDPRSSSTSFRIRGKELRVDLLTPLTGRAPRGPVFVPAFNARAAPLRLLDQLIEDPLAVPLVGATGLALVNVPRPERFALHKLLVSESRGVGFANKAQKDRLQAVQILEALLQEAPDALASAKKDIARRGKGWTDRLARAVRKISGQSPEVAAALSGK